MPIDFAAIARQFQPRTESLLESVVIIFSRLEKWLKPRAQQMSGIERATRMFPVLRFYNDALTAHIATFQHRTLTPIEPTLSVMQSAGAGARQFLSGFERIPEAVGEALTLPHLLAAVERLLDVIMDGIRRYAEPTPALFDPRQPRRFTDIIGQAVLFFRATGTSLDQIRAFSSNVTNIKQAWNETFGRPETSPTAQASPSEQQPTFMQIDQITGYLAGALLALPLLGLLLHNLMSAGIIAAKLAMLDIFEQIEGEVFDLRATVINLIANDLFRFAEMAIIIADGAKVVVSDNLRFYLNFAVDYAFQALDNVRTFLTRFSTWMRQLFGLLYNWALVLDRIMDVEVINLLEILGPSLLLGTVRTDLPRITLRDLITQNAEAAGMALVAVIETARQALRSHPLGQFGELVLRRRLDALEEIILTLTDETLRRRFLRELSAGGAFRRPPVDFPNIHDAFFGPGAPPIQDSLRRARESVENAVAGVLEGSANLLNDASASYLTAADQAARLDSRRYRRLAQTADRLANNLFGGQYNPPPAEGLARAFEQAFTRGGFELVGRLIPVYVMQIEQYWQEERASNIEVQKTPTSPHIIARRQRLGRVEAPELVIRLPQRSLNRALIELVVSRFDSAVNQMYLTGQACHANTGQTLPGQ